MKTALKFAGILFLFLIVAFSFGCLGKSSSSNNDFSNEPTKGGAATGFENEPTRTSSLIQFCLGFKDRQYQIACSAAMSGNYSMCDEIATKYGACKSCNDKDQIYQASKCRALAVAAIGDASLCTKINTSNAAGGDIGGIGLSYNGFDLTDECYLQVALTTKDKTVCAKYSAKDACERQVAMIKGDYTLASCKNIGVDCYYKYAILKNDSKACDSIEGDALGFYKPTCRAMIFGDEQMCREIHDVDGWYYCQSQVRFAKTSDSKGNFFPEMCGDNSDCEEGVVFAMAMYAASH